VTSQLDALTSLKTLWLQQNLLTSFPDVTGPAVTLETFSLQSNLLTTLPTWTNYAALKTLYMGTNPYSNSEIDLSLFASNTNLDYLYAGFTDGKRLIVSNPSSVPPSLREIHASYNNMGEIPDLSSISSSLQVLHLDSNSINNLLYYKDRVNALTNLRQLYLKLNGMKTMGNLCELRTLDKLDLKWNNFHCDCKLRWLKAADLTGVSADSVIVDNCASPPNLASLTWDQLSLDDLKCSG